MNQSIYQLQKGKIISLKSRSKIHFIESSKITHLICDGYLTTIYCTDGQFYSNTKSLKVYEGELSSIGFIRANRSTLVNLIHVMAFHMGARRELELSNSTIIKVSRRRVFMFRNCHSD